jgi:hypothetical protein
MVMGNLEEMMACAARTVAEEGGGRRRGGAHAAPPARRRSHVPRALRGCRGAVEGYRRGARRGERERLRVCRPLRIYLRGPARRRRSSDNAA